MSILDVVEDRSVDGLTRLKLWSGVLEPRPGDPGCSWRVGGMISLLSKMFRDAAEAEAIGTRPQFPLFSPEEAPLLRLAEGR
jgi:hypothetical protein